MKKVLCLAVMAGMMFIGVAMAAEEVKPFNLIAYQDNDWTVGIDGISGFIGYDFNHREICGGAKVALIQYKIFNLLEVGIVDNVNNYDDQGISEGLLGMSVDVPKIELSKVPILNRLPDVIKNNVYLDGGAFLSDQIDGKFNKDTWRYGVQGGIKYVRKFD